MTQAGQPVSIGGITIGPSVRVGGTAVDGPIVVPGDPGGTSDRVVPLLWEQPVEATEWLITHPGYRLAAAVVHDASGYVDPDLDPRPGETRIQFAYPTIGRADLTLIQLEGP